MARLDLAAAGLSATSGSVLAVRTPSRAARAELIFLSLLRHLRLCFLVGWVDGSRKRADISSTRETVYRATLVTAEAVDAIAGAS